MKTKLNIMKTSNKISRKSVKMLIVCLLLAGSFTASAQIGLPNGGDANVPDAPIDGFLTISLIAGTCIGLRKGIKGLKK